MHLMISFTKERPYRNVDQILYRPTHQLREGSMTQGYSKLQNLCRSLEKNFV